MADKLGEIADAVGTVTWPSLSASIPTSAAPPYTYGQTDASAIAQGTSADYWAEWDIPPQADADRFIVRDLAIHTLGMLPTLDAYTDILNQSCATTLSQVAIQSPLGTTGLVLDPTNDQEFSSVFGTYAGTATNPNSPVFPPSNVPFIDAQGNNNSPKIALTALQLQAQILRSGGRLLHDLIRRDVYSDLAASAQQATQAGGNQAAWTGTASNPYGTIAHAARVLLGRWEIGDEADFGVDAQPTCEGVSAINLLSSALGTDFPARVGDVSIHTPGEALAAQLVEQSGIVIPTCQLATMAPTALSSMLINQLLLQEENQNGLSTPQAVAAFTDQLSPALTNTVATIAPNELLFAFQRAVRTWDLLTNTPDTSTTAGCAAPIADSTGATPLPGSLVLATSSQGAPMLASGVLPYGIVVANGLACSPPRHRPHGARRRHSRGLPMPRNDIDVDRVGRARGAQDHRHFASNGGLSRCVSHRSGDRAAPRVSPHCRQSLHGPEH